MQADLHTFSFKLCTHSQLLCILNQSFLFKTRNTFMKFEVRRDAIIHISENLHAPPNAVDFL